MYVIDLFLTLTNVKKHKTQMELMQQKHQDPFPDTEGHINCKSSRLRNVRHSKFRFLWHFKISESIKFRTTNFRLAFIFSTLAVSSSY